MSAAAANFSAVGLTVTSSLPPSSMVTVTCAVGSLVSLTVKSSAAPASVVAVEPPLSTTLSPAVSSSVVLTLTVESLTTSR